jgi:hypothetical protein
MGGDIDVVSIKEKNVDKIENEGINNSKKEKYLDKI